MGPCLRSWIVASPPTIASGSALELVERAHPGVEVAADLRTRANDAVLHQSHVEVALDGTAELEGIAAEEHILAEASVEYRVVEHQPGIALDSATGGEVEILDRRHAAALDVAVDPGAFGHRVEGSTDAAGEVEIPGEHVEVALDAPRDVQALDYGDDIALDRPVDADALPGEHHALVDGLPSGDVHLVVEVEQHGASRCTAGPGDAEEERHRGAEDAPVDEPSPEAEERGNARQRTDRQHELDEPGRCVSEEEDEVESHFVGSLEAQGVEDVESAGHLGFEECTSHSEHHRHRGNRNGDAERHTGLGLGVWGGRVGGSLATPQHIAEKGGLISQGHDSGSAVSTAHQVRFEFVAGCAFEHIVYIGGEQSFVGVAHSHSFSERTSRSLRRAR